VSIADEWDRTALREGASVAAMIAVPLTLIARFAFDQGRSSGWATILALGSFFGFVLGAGVAAWRQTKGTPLTHALVTAIGVFLGAQFVFVLVRLLQGEIIRWGKISVSLAFTVGAGLLGGFLGSFLQRKGVTPYR